MSSFSEASRSFCKCFQLKKQAKERERQEKKEAKEKEQHARAQARERIKMSKDKEKLLKKVCVIYFDFISHKNTHSKKLHVIISTQKIGKKMS